MAGRRRVLIPAGAALHDRLFDLGVEFPCGGEGWCGGCRVRVVQGEVPITAGMRDVLSREELEAGWRLGCQAGSEGALELEVEQWETAVLTDETSLTAEPRDGFGVCIDLGTTTLVAQLVSLADGQVLDVKTALNPQARFGADIMSRIQYDLRHPGVLRDSIRAGLGRLVEGLCAGRQIEEILICGNTAMQHLFAGLDVSPLAAAPFRPASVAGSRHSSHELGWAVALRNGVEFLPSIGGFVGSDILAGLVACRPGAGGGLEALMDLGTNGEIAVAAQGRFLCASTAAGPAFEGGRISCGMRAGSHAIDQVWLKEGRLELHVIGGGAASGICGSGLVDAAAAALEAGWMGSSGRLLNARKEIELTPAVRLTQRDIRELQLAKGAVAAGLQMLTRIRGGRRVERLHLAGAFGNYLRAASARAIGLIPHEVEVKPAGNAALRGARSLLLLAPRRRGETIRDVLSRTEHIELASDAAFQDVFAESMAFTSEG